MSYWIHPDAETELGDAAVYYAKHAGFAISEAFLLEFERVIEILVENQGRGPYGEFGFRVYHFGRFPYSVVYEEHALAGHRSMQSLINIERQVFGLGARNVTQRQRNDG